MNRFPNLVLALRSHRIPPRQVLWSLSVAIGWIIGASLLLAGTAEGDVSEPWPSVVSLDGTNWLSAVDPGNVGRVQRWFTKPVPEAKAAKVPWIIQDLFPNYHGIVWYWRRFQAPPLPYVGGRYLLRFWAVSYRANVWVNGTLIGSHEGGETPFTLDVTDSIKPGEENLIAVRDLNPFDKSIDGIVLNQTPHRNQTPVFTTGCDYDHGGLEDSVELFVAPPERIDDLFVRANPKTGLLSVNFTALNVTSNTVNGTIELAVSPATGGQTLITRSLESHLKTGSNQIHLQLAIANPHLWELNDPYLYRVTVKLAASGSGDSDEQSVRCGFRDFSFERGYFRLNGRRIYLRSSVSGDMSPIGIHVAYDTDWFRRDLINSKAMGFNAIRFYGMPTRYQLDLCDEIGLMVYEESFSSQLYEDSPAMVERFDRSTSEMILRDRNHPSIVIWGLLNETVESRQFRHAVGSLAMVRSLDDTRMVLLSSGRFDGQFNIGSISNPGSKEWDCLLGKEDAKAPERTNVALVLPSCPGTGDAHIYPQVPHKADAIQLLRTYGQEGKHVFLSEYGIASADDLPRIVRNFEERGRGNSEECLFYRHALEQFLADWKKWGLAGCFGRPEDYFSQCLRSMATQRLIGINALRANPNIVGYDLTGTSDQGYTGEGLTTAFRDLKPGTVDAIFDGLAPLRWCLFAEPVNVYRGKTVKLEAVLANEDRLAAGAYPVKLDVFGPNSSLVFEQHITVNIPDPGSEPPLALPVFSNDIVASWPTGKYRLVAAFESGASAAGLGAEFTVSDADEMPKVESKVALWGDDKKLMQWLDSHHINWHPFVAGSMKEREVILAGQAVPANEAAGDAFKKLASQIAEGSTAIFLDPNVFAVGAQPASLKLLGKNGILATLQSGPYHKDDWVKRHPIFKGLPAGGLMDTPAYREVIGNQAWEMDPPPEECVAGSIYAFPSYDSGLTVLVDKLGSGRIILNTLSIRDNLARDPTSDRILLNMLRYAAQ